jgi:restriction endonuclease S subunit
MRLSDLSELKAGRRPALAPGEAPAVARALTIKDGDLIVGARGAATDVCVASDPVFGAFISLDLYLVRPDRAIVDPQFLAAFFELPSTQMTFAAGKQGTSLSRLSKEALEQIQVPLPPMLSQRQIAELARSVQEESRLLKRLAELKSYFGREAVARAIRATDAHHRFNGNRT